jgi:hypothetical protein
LAQVLSACVFVEQDSGAVFADGVQDFHNLLEVAPVVGRKSEADVTKVTIAVLEILLALLTLSSLGRGSEAAIERTMCGEGSFAAGASTKVVNVAIGDFDDGLLYHVLVGSVETVRDGISE